MKHLNKITSVILAGMLGLTAISGSGCAKKEKSEAKEETVKEIRIVTFTDSQEIEEKAIKFNKNNSEYKIVIEPYLSQSDMNNHMNISEAKENFYRSIISDNAPDIIEVNDLDFYDVAAKGVLEDLTPYFENDSELKDVAFVDSVVKVSKLDGKLYCMPVGFYISALVGAKSEVGEKTSWNMEEFINYTNSLENGTEVFTETTCEAMLALIQYNIFDYIDWNTGKCSFDTEEFVNLLKLCHRYETAEKYYANEDNLIISSDAEEISAVRENKIALMRLILNDVSQYQKAKLAFLEDIVIKGYPVSEGNGIVVHKIYPALAINAKSKYKDKAWEFVREWYDYDEQLNTYPGFPVRKDALEKVLQDAKNVEVMIAEDGTEYYTEISSGTIDIKVPVPTGEDIEEIMEMIDKGDTVIGNMNTDIYNIIYEEAESFFSGNKSAEEVAQIIQSRVSVYVKEHS